MPTFFSRRRTILKAKPPWSSSSARPASLAAQLLYRAGVFCLPANNDTSVLQFLPPLVITDAELTELIDRVREAFRALA